MHSDGWVGGVEIKVQLSYEALSTYTRMYTHTHTVDPGLLCKKCKLIYFEAVQSKV